MVLAAWHQAGSKSCHRRKAWQAPRQSSFQPPMHVPKSRTNRSKEGSSSRSRKASTCAVVCPLDPHQCLSLLLTHPLSSPLPPHRCFSSPRQTHTPPPSASHAALHHDGAHRAPFGPADGAHASPVRTLSVWRMSVDVARRGRGGRGGCFGVVVAARFVRL